ncbi:MAG: glycosyltransferase family 4 protein [Thermohalobaculum sp.]|nr:glycosyltransferase family 4 protein [Thermohalobaculum sp.]
MRHSAPRIVVVMPRNMHFGPARATSIDLCAHDFVRASRFAATTTVVAEAVERPFEGVHLVTHAPGDRRGRDALIRAARPDLVVVHQHLPSAAHIARLLPGTPVLAHRHNMVKPPSGPIARLHHAWRMRNLAGLIFVSDFCKAAFERDWGHLRLPRHTVHNALAMDDWQPLPPEARQKVIAYTGRVDPLKGVVELAEALATLLPGAPDWRAHLMLTARAAQQATAARVEALLHPVRAQVTIDYDRTLAEVRSLLCGAAVAAVPTISDEPFGRAALEAMAGGAALVASARGGLPEVFGDTAIALPGPSRDSIVDALGRLMADDALRHRLAQAGRARAVAEFDLGRIAARLDAVYQTTLARAATPGRP